jgi:hypothetical protein
VGGGWGIDDRKLSIECVFKMMVEARPHKSPVD